jgi:hypothetical protein
MADWRRMPNHSKIEHMVKPFRLVAKVLRILVNRIRTQGPRNTLIWFYARGLPLLSGAPILKYSRITPQVFVGPQYRRAGKRTLEAAGIHYAVNMRIEYDDAAHGLALENYCYLPTLDDTPPSFEQFEQGSAFIEKAIADGGKVYIHCAGGIGRAPSMAAAYLVSQGIALDRAIEMIRRTRPFVRFTPVQLEQLQRWVHEVAARKKVG